MRYFGVTDKGLIRKNNQDNYIVSYNVNKDVLVIVCDGIGGNNAGDVASYAAISYFSDIFSENNGFDDLVDAKAFLSQHIAICNQKIHKMGVNNDNYQGMGTTLVGILVLKKHILAFNVGDSRVYSFKNNQLTQVTIDHNFSNEMLSKGVLSKEKMENHPKRNYLTRAIGVSDSVVEDFFEIENQPEFVLVSSDGLHGYVSDEDIATIIHDRTLALPQKTNALLDAALRSGGYDNITIVLVEFTGDDYGY